MQIVKASIDDIDSVSPLFNLYRVFYGQNSDLEKAHAFLKERILNNESIIFIAKNDIGTVVGFTQLYPSFSSISVSRSWILNDLYVIAEARRTGVAKKLMDAAKAFAMRVHAKGITLETATDNITAQNLYESIGYTKNTDSYYYFLEFKTDKI